MNAINKQDLIIGYNAIKKVIDYYIAENNIVFKTSYSAPNKFKEMKQSFKDLGYYEVYRGGDHGHLGEIYNCKFRAIHDFMHLKYNLTFKFEDERTLSKNTVKEFSEIAWDKLNCTAWECFMVRSIVNAEIKGQIDFYEANKKYVDDQKSFIEDYLNIA